MVKLSKPLMFGTGIQEYEALIAADRLRTERSDRLRAMLRKHGLASCLLTRGDNVRYGVSVWPAPLPPQMCYAFFPVEGDPVVWDLAGWKHDMEDRMYWLKPENYRVARYWIGSAVGPDATQWNAGIFAQEVKEVLQQQGLLGEKLGVVSFDKAALEALAEAGIKTVDASPIMMEARAIKTRDEINCLKMSASIADGAFYALYEAIKPGVRDRDVKAAALKYIWEAGGVTNDTLPIFSGPHTGSRGVATTDRIINTGDIVYVDVAGMTYLGYNTCIYRTYKVGCKATQKEKDWYQRALDKLNGAIDEIKPGATTADAAKHFSPSSEWGFEDENEMYSMDVGHGIGLASYEYPCISRRDSFMFPQVFEAGMVIAVETFIGERGAGGARIEDMVVVTENGAELLDRTPRDEIIVTHAMV